MKPIIYGLGTPRPFTAQCMISNIPSPLLFLWQIAAHWPLGMQNAKWKLRASDCHWLCNDCEPVGLEKNDIRCRENDMGTDFDPPQCADEGGRSRTLESCCRDQHRQRRMHLACCLENSSWFRPSDVLNRWNFGQAVMVAAGMNDLRWPGFSGAIGRSDWKSPLRCSPQQGWCGPLWLMSSTGDVRLFLAYDATVIIWSDYHLHCFEKWFFSFHPIMRSSMSTRKLLMFVWQLKTFMDDNYSFASIWSSVVVEPSANK